MADIAASFGICLDLFVNLSQSR